MNTKKTRWRNVAVAVVIVGIGVGGAKLTDEWWQLGFFGAAALWGIAGTYRMNLRLSSDSLPTEAGFATGLQFCRKEIERQTEAISSAIVWGLGPAVLGLGTLVVALMAAAQRANVDMKNALPFLALCLAWGLGFLVLQWKQRKALRDELSRLDAMERELRT